MPYHSYVPDTTMVRRIRSCETCHLRFVALANSPLCSNCCGSDGIDNSSSLQAKNEEVAFLDSDGIDCSETESMKSEGGDEIHCTQLVQEDDAESSSHSTIEQQLIPVTAAVLDEGNKHSISKKACEAQRHTMLNDTNSASATGDVCFICGTSLSSLKRRLDHIKRCSKKHSITGRDVKVNTELDAFEAVSNESRSKACSSSLNPYTKGSSWHGDANLTLKIAASTEGTAMQESCTEQTVLTSFFNHPVKNINNILLAGARRMTKTAELVAANKSKQLFRGRKRQRGSFGGRNYTFDCPMYKKIPGTDFVCDGFHYAKR